MDKPIIARREVTNHILHTFKLKADKRLGQNFLIDEEVVRRIVAAAELSEDDTVLEVGPGIGTLTQGLAQSGARVVARRQRLRRFVSFDPILYRAGDSLYRTAGILYPGAQCR